MPARRLILLAMFTILAHPFVAATAENDLREIIDTGVKAGKKKIVIPAGRYRVTPVRRTHLSLQDLRDVQIIADGVEMVCTETTRAITFENCRNVRLQGLTIDYDPLPFTQGKIVKLAPDKSWVEFVIFEGYPENPGARIEIFDGKTHQLKTRTHHGWGQPKALGNRRYRVEKSKHHRFNRDADIEEVGDVLVTSSSHAPGGQIPHAIVSNKCMGLVLKDVRVYASNCFTYFETNCDGTTYENCILDRRPAKSDLKKRGYPRLRSGNADAFHSKYASTGPRITKCTARYMGDDAVNICGSYHMITQARGSTLRVLAKDKHLDIAVGDKVELWSYDGRRIPDAGVKKITPVGAINDKEKGFLKKQRMDARLKTNGRGALTKAFVVELDRNVDLPMGSLICSTSKTGNGFSVTGCTFGPNRSRGILIKGSKGLVQGNSLTGCWGQAIKVAPEYWWLESGSSCDVKIRDNVISDCRDIAIAVYAFSGSGKLAPVGAHRNIEIQGNRISNCPLPNIYITSTAKLSVEKNTFVNTGKRSLPPWVRHQFRLTDKKLEPVMKLNCR